MKLGGWIVCGIFYLGFPMQEKEHGLIEDASSMLWFLLASFGQVFVRPSKSKYAGMRLSDGSKKSPVGPG